MNGIAIEKTKNIEWLYKTLCIRFWRFEFRIYCKWQLWGRKYNYINTGKMAGRKGFVLYLYPFAFSYQKPRN